MTVSRPGSSDAAMDTVLPAMNIGAPSEEALSQAMRTGAVGLQAASALFLAAMALGSLAAAMGSKLTTKLAVDVLSGCTAALAVSPFVALVDGAVARSLANKTPPTRELWLSLSELARAPRLALFRLDFYFTAFVYTVTYLTANIALTLQAGSLLRLALIAGANMWSGVKKDAFIARSNPAGGGTAARPVGTATLALFCARDVNAIGASFVLPRLLAPHVSRWLPHVPDSVAGLACQVLTPPLCELLNTQVHLLALDVYNQPGSSAGERARTVARQYPSSLVVRIMRVLVAFSLGGMGNRAMRSLLQQALCLA